MPKIKKGSIASEYLGDDASIEQIAPTESTSTDIGSNIEPLSSATTVDAAIPNLPVSPDSPATESLRKNNTPPFIQKRNDYGLLENVDYVFDPETGRVDWRKMVPTKFLYFNPQVLEDPKRRAAAESRYSRPITDVKIEDANDRDLVISLAGLKHIADIRGYSYVALAPLKGCNEQYAAVCCTINWTGNYETEGRECSFDSCASAHFNNTNNLGSRFLVEIAENRAFSRAVRNFLRINIVSQDEISGPKQQEESQVVTPFTTLKQVMEEKGVLFETIKKKLIEENVEDAENINAVEDIPKIKVFELIHRIKAKKK